MADTTIEAVSVGEIEPVNSDERRNMLAEQLESAPAVTNPEPSDDPKPAGDRPRQPDGKFAAKAEAAPAPVAETPVIEEPAWKRPPQSWKKEAHAHWEKMTPEVAQYVHEREQQMRQGIEQAIPKVRAYDNLSKVVAPYMENIKVAAGGDVVAAVKGLMEADNILRTAPHDQKRGYLMRLAQMYGINLGDVSDAPQVMPEMFQLKQELASLRGELTAEKQAKQEAETNSLLEQIQEFATKNEHFETLKPTMIRLLNAGEAVDLQAAYTKAMRLNDDLFQAEQQAQQAAQRQETIKGKDVAAKAAKFAAASVRTGTPSGNTAPKAQDRRSMLSEQFSEQDGRL